MAKIEVRPLYRVRILPLVKDRPGYSRRWIRKDKYDYWQTRGYDKVVTSEKILGDPNNSVSSESDVKQAREMILVETPVENVKKHREMMDLITKQRSQHISKSDSEKGLSGKQVIKKGGKIVLDSKEDDEED